MGSYNDGKTEVVEWIKSHFQVNQTCLDVGACNGKWSKLLGDYLIMDGIEVYEPYVTMYGTRKYYRQLYISDIRNFHYEYYDLIIFGDVLEHLSVEEAQKVLEYAYSRCDNFIIAVPYCMPQADRDGNPYEVHQQADLTPENMFERYKNISLLWRNDRYGYYIKEANNDR